MKKPRFRRLRKLLLHLRITLLASRQDFIGWRVNLNLRRAKRLEARQDRLFDRQRRLEKRWFELG